MAMFIKIVFITFAHNFYKNSFYNIRTQFLLRHVYNKLF